MESPGHLLLDDWAEIDQLRRKRNRTWPGHRMVLRRELGIIAVFAVLLSNFLAQGGGVHSQDKKPTALEMEQYVNLKADPCDNFYEFACGGFIDKTPIPPIRKKVSTIRAVDYLVAQRLKSIVEGIKPSKPGCSMTLKDNYHRCMMDKPPKKDTDVKNLGLELKGLGGWPVIDGKLWNEKNFDWTKTIQKFPTGELSSNYLFELKIQFDDGGRPLFAFINQPHHLSIPLPYELTGYRIRMADLLESDDEMIKAYLNYMVEVAVVMGADRNYAKTELEKSLKFEIDLTKIIVPRAKQVDYKKKTLAQMAVDYPSVPWKKLVANLLPSANINERFVMRSNVFDYIDALIRLMNSTPKKTQANYLLWMNFDKHFVPRNNDLMNHRAAFARILSGATEPLPHWEECINYVMEKFPSCVDEIYMDKYHEDENMLNNVAEIAGNILTQYTKKFQEVKGMQKDLKAEALRTLKNINIKIGSLILHENDRKRDKSRKTSSYQVGTGLCWTPQSETIWIPVPRLQNPLYNDDRPKYMNYGSLGFSIGHEITHAIEKSIPKTLVDCIIKQYGNYKVENVKLNLDGDRTKYENLADNAGLKVAYLAYVNWAKTNKTELKLPGFDYTPRQMFWISLGHLWCTKYTNQELKSMIEFDKHSPAEHRILGTLSNSPDFAKDFKCKIGRMNPKDKCTIF